jgi:prolipoprotein diacylglyceryltransferase
MDALFHVMHNQKGFQPIQPSFLYELILKTQYFVLHSTKYHPIFV